MTTTTQQAIASTQFPQTNYYSDCYNFALEFIKTHYKFTSEDLKKAYAASGNPQPDEPRVWGAVIANLRRDQLIKFDSIVKYQNPVGHGKPCYKWVSNHPLLNVELEEFNFNYKKDLYELLQRVEIGGITAESAHQLICDMVEIQILKSQLKTR